MNRRIFACCLPVLCLATLGSTVYAQWSTPTAEELSMTSQAEVPGAPAVYLYRESINDDQMHELSVYERIKVLTDRGKEHATVELTQFERDDIGYTVGDIQGRTIHPDGTIIHFTGKPFERLVEKSTDSKLMAKVFTMPDVEVGSIIEYRYNLILPENVIIIPDWFVQSELYTRKSHYMWKTFDDKQFGLGSNAISWTPFLPEGFAVKQTHVDRSAQSDAKTVIELNLHDVPPIPEEDYMPPVKSLSYRVLFYLSPYRSVYEFWEVEGKNWSKTTNKFIGPGSKVKETAASLVSASDSDDQKLRKLYAAVMKLDNTSYNRDRSVAEDKSHGLDPAKSTEDVLVRGRGTENQIALVFAALARAAGLNASIMAVADRDSRIFMGNYLRLSQLQDNVAIVTINGKEQFFDPGQRYCPYGHLAWKHTMTRGLRQTESGTEIVETPSEPYTASRSQRVANLALDEHGVVTGTVKIAWTGAPALNWRQASLRGDSTSLDTDLREALEHMLPNGMDVMVGAIEHLEDYEQPLTVNYTVKGPIGSSTGKRLLIPADFFEANSKPVFPHEKREFPVSFEYPSVMQDALRITFPASLALASMPASEQIPLHQFAAYALKTETTPTSVTVRREFDMVNILYRVDEYSDLRAFYNKLETKDQEPVVLTFATAGGHIVPNSAAPATQ